MKRWHRKDEKLVEVVRIKRLHPSHYDILHRGAGDIPERKHAGTHTIQLPTPPSPGTYP